MEFGLNQETINKINSVFSKHPEIDKVIIYGSRAKGNYRAGSDIDISMYGNDLNYDLIGKVNLFGFHFATLDVRQNSKIHNIVIRNILEYNAKLKLNIFPENYSELNAVDRFLVLDTINAQLNPSDFKDSITKSTLESIYAMKNIQEKNGEFGCNRYIISNNESTLNVLETFALFKLCDWNEPSVDIIPLFEVIDDLQNADKIMEQLYLNESYLKHIKERRNQQTVMLGFSEGTKDDGYLMANWSIYKAKEIIKAICRK